VVHAGLLSVIRQAISPFSGSGRLICALSWRRFYQQARRRRCPSRNFLFNCIGVSIMAQIIASIDQGSVNELFVKTYNAWPTMPVQPFGLSRSVGVSPFMLSLNMGVNSEVTPKDFPAGAQPIDLRPAGAVPHISYAGLGMRVHSQVQGSLKLGNASRSFGWSFDTDVTISGGAQASAVDLGSNFQARLQLTVGDITLSFAANRNDVINAAKNAASQFDTNPFLAGTQKLPQPVIDAIGAAAGQVFDQIAALAAEAARQLIRTRLGALRLLLTSAIPDNYSIAIPGSAQSVPVQMQNLQLGVGNERITLTVTFV
jgi:hypothetical protein